MQFQLSTNIKNKNTDASIKQMRTSLKRLAIKHYVFFLTGSESDLSHNIKSICDDGSAEGNSTHCLKTAATLPRPCHLLSTGATIVNKY